MSEQFPGGPIPQSPGSGAPPAGGGLRGILIGLMLPVIIVGGILAAPIINGEIYPPRPILGPFVDAGCWSHHIIRDIFRDFTYPIVCDYYEFPRGGTRGPGRTDSCGLACDLATGDLCPEGYDCVSGSCQNDVVCGNACGQTCTSDADCPGGLSCIEDCGEYGSASDECTGVFFCYNLTICSNPPDSACGRDCRGSQDCAAGLVCDFGACSSPEESFCDGCGVPCETSADCQAGYVCAYNAVYDSLTGTYRGSACWNESTCGRLPSYAVIDPVRTESACGDGICSATEVDTCCGVGQDCTVAITCGDGICSACENAANCPSDCASTSACEPGPFCGDGVCETACGEGFYNCPTDCGEALSAAFCGSTCSSNEDCAGLGPNPVCASGQCYDAQACRPEDAGSTGGEGGSEGGGKPAECGNGVVEAGEACDGNQNGSCNWDTQYCNSSCSCQTLE